MKDSTLFAGLQAYAAQSQWQYLYPVISRRSGGISIGINLHPNQTCNWHCIYCQVPGLHRGKSPVISMLQLEIELQACLHWLSSTLKNTSLKVADMVHDIAFAGDGEPTTSPQFSEAVDLLSHLLKNYPQHARPNKIRLITNGSQLHHLKVQSAIRMLKKLNGEVWFKLDAGNDAEMWMINQSMIPLSLHIKRLQLCCKLCPTWIQTAVISHHNPQDIQPLITPGLKDYLNVIEAIRHQIEGIFLYAVSRPTCQAAGSNLLPLSKVAMDEYESVLITAGYHVRAYM